MDQTLAQILSYVFQLQSEIEQLRPEVERLRIDNSELRGVMRSTLPVIDIDNRPPTKGKTG
jgi:hypothetical protein